MGYDYITKPATEGQVLELLDQISKDEARIERITADYELIGLTPNGIPEYERLADRIRLRFSLAEDYWAKIQARDDYDDESNGYKLHEYSGPVRLNGVDMAIKSQDPEFIKWVQEQVALAELWDWER